MANLANHTCQLKPVNSNDPVYMDGNVKLQTGRRLECPCLQLPSKWLTWAFGLRHRVEVWSHLKYNGPWSLGAGFLELKFLLMSLSWFGFERY